MSIFNYNAQKDGFARPLLGGSVAFRYGTITFSDASAVSLGTLPAGATIVDWLIITKTAFNAGTTNTIDIGLGGTGDALANNVAAGAVGVYRMGATGTSLTQVGVPLTTDTTLTATYEQSGTAATTGSAIVLVAYVMK
jgi:hypothetical protein